MQIISVTNLFMNLLNHRRIHDFFAILHGLVNQEPLPDEALVSLASRDLQLPAILNGPSHAVAVQNVPQLSGNLGLVADLDEHFGRPQGYLEVNEL